MRLLLLGDVMTTGSTANECSKVLLRAGAKEVLVLTLARANYLWHFHLPHLIILKINIKLSCLMVMYLQKLHDLIQARDSCSPSHLPAFYSSHC
jgi:hypothetical protein